MRDNGTTSKRKLNGKQQDNALEILDAAASAFARRGYAATSIDDVADILGCTKGRIYHYYRTKGELFIGIHHRAMVWALESVEPVAVRTDMSATVKLREMVRRHALHLMEKTDYMGPAQVHAELNLAREGRNKDTAAIEIFEMRRRFESHFRGVLSEGMESGEFRRGDTDVLTKAVLGASNWMSVWFHAGSPHDTKEGREAIALEFSEFAVRGVLASNR